MFGIRSLTKAVRRLNRTVGVGTDAILVELHGIRVALRRIAGAENPVGRFYLRHAGEVNISQLSRNGPRAFYFLLVDYSLPEGEMKVAQKFTAVLPQQGNPEAPESKDAVRGEVRLVLDRNDGSTPIEIAPISTEIGQAELENIIIKEGVTVSGTFLFVDNAGHISRNPSVLESFTVSDVTPPSDPVGGFGLRSEGEAPDEEAL